MKIRIVIFSDLWSCGDGGMLRLFLSKLPPPTRRRDAAKMELDSLLFLCDLFCIVFFVVLWFWSRWLVRWWVSQATLIGVCFLVYLQH